MDILILGCGFTGIRVAQRFISKGAQVTVTTRDPERLSSLRARVITLSEVPGHIKKGILVLHSIPPEGSAQIPALLQNAPARVVYLSTTAVYGATHLVDENTPVDEQDQRAHPRLIDESRVANGPWSSLILRPAGIYGPGRGAHESVRRGTYVAGDNNVSRIHVDDLATHAEAALLSNIVGAYPVADEFPVTTREVAEFCKALLAITESREIPSAVGRAPSSAEDPLVRQRSSLPSQSSILSKVQNEPNRPPRPVSNRKVDGSAIRRALGITLAYPSYRTGIPAALAEHNL